MLFQNVMELKLDQAYPGQLEDRDHQHLVRHLRQPSLMSLILPFVQHIQEIGKS